MTTLRPFRAPLGSLVLALATLGPLACSSTKASNVGPADSAAAVTWTAVYGEVMTQCTDHHSGGATAAGNLDLGSQSNAYAALVGVPASGASCSAAALDGAAPALRVSPHDSAASLLYQKLAGTQTCGTPMPALGQELPADQVALVKSWIDEGAPNN